MPEQTYHLKVVSESRHIRTILQVIGKDDTQRAVQDLTKECTFTLEEGTIATPLKRHCSVYRYRSGLLNMISSF